MHWDTILSRLRPLLIAALVIGIGSLAFAQYDTSYPYARQPAPRLPGYVNRVGGFVGNPYRKSTVRPTGMPIGSRQNYFGSAGYRGGNSLGHRPIAKPFSNVRQTGPLVTSREVARMEIMRGLWH